MALLIVLASGAWLVAVALLMAFRPLRALRLFDAMTARLKAADWRASLIEQSLRIVAGAALIVRAPQAKLPLVFEAAGWLLVVSSLLILAAPVRWHAAYGEWWLDRLAPEALRVLSPLPAFAGLGLIWSSL